MEFEDVDLLFDELTRFIYKIGFICHEKLNVVDKNDDDEKIVYDFLKTLPTIIEHDIRNFIVNQRIKKKEKTE